LPKNIYGYEFERFLKNKFNPPLEQTNIDIIPKSNMISQCYFGFFRKRFSDIFRFYLNIKECNNKNQVICENKKSK
jgi:hypothetical protein